MRRFGLLACLALLLSALPFAASAQRAYAISGADIFAGPGSDYPVVAHLGPGVGLNLNGCLADYSWCDVSFAGSRGWVYAGDLGYPYQRNRVPVLEYGPRLGLPIVTFSLGNYWDHYYRGRPWYRERNDWARRYPEHRNDYRGNREGWRGNDNWRGREGYGRGQDMRRQDFRGNESRREAPRVENRGPQGRANNEGGLPTGRPGTNEASRVSPSTPGYYTGQQ
jgi:uncharacterized protein YraI